MDKKEKKQLSESDICDLLITPAIKDAGWDPMRQIRREVTLTPGPVIVRGNMSSRNKKKKKFADYVLYREPGVPIAVVEAKDNNHTVSQGMQQALGYAEILQVPSVFSSNGDAFASHNKAAIDGEDIETQFPLESFPSPDEIWRRYKSYRGMADEDETLLVAPYHSDGSGKEPRYYQIEAINRTIEAITRGQKRVLLVMATGTGKTYTTFQIIWRLWKAKAASRILFLADRNILIDQTLVKTLLAALTRPTTGADGAETNAQKIFFQHFDTLFTTERSIDQLKQTILQLAVMGRLVPQDPDDEPASELLQRIAEEKKLLIKAGKIKKQKLLPEIGKDEKSFELPETWKWSRLQQLVFLLGDGLHGTPIYTPGEKFYFINGNNFIDGKIVIKPNTKTVSKDEFEKHKKNLATNAVLISINGTLGRVAFYYGEEVVLGKSACYFNPSEYISKHYLKLLLESPNFLGYAQQNATGSTIKNLSLKAMNHYPIPLPPISEQHRIVAKVDELMTLCDTLKAQLSDTQTTQLQLADTIIEQAVS